MLVTHFLRYQSSNQPCSRTPPPRFYRGHAPNLIRQSCCEEHTKMLQSDKRNCALELNELGSQLPGPSSHGTRHSAPSTPTIGTASTLFSVGTCVHRKIEGSACAAGAPHLSTSTNLRLRGVGPLPQQAKVSPFSIPLVSEICGRTWLSAACRSLRLSAHSRSFNVGFERFCQPHACVVSSGGKALPPTQWKMVGNLMSTKAHCPKKWQSHPYCLN